MSGVIFAMIVAVLFLLMGVSMFFGKGGWLIAGYNTMTENEKKKINKKLLFKSMSVTCIIVSVMLFVLAFMGYKVETGAISENAMIPFAIVFICVVMGTVVFDMVVINVRKK